MNDITIGIITGTLVIILLIVGIFRAFSIILKQRFEEEKKLTDAKLAYEKEIRLVTNEVSEKMLTQIAYELHDNIGQLLTVVHVQVENLKIDAPHFNPELAKIADCLGQATQQLRTLSRTLNNDFVGKLKLVEALKIETDRLNSMKRFQVHLDASSCKNLTKDEELMVFRIFQEISQNALKYSKAKNFYVSIKDTEEQFIFSTSDDGIGFDVKAIFDSKKANGLSNIIKRAKLASLECNIKSEPNKGTTITLKRNLQT